MKRQPPAFLERLVGRLLPRASREHVLGDLAERYSSRALYIIDAGRTIPFVVGSQVRRSRVLAAWAGGTAVTQVALVLLLVGIIRVSVELERGAVPPDWFLLVITFVVLFVAYLYRANAALYAQKGSSEKHALLRRIAKTERRLQLSFVPGIFLGAMPLLQMAAARMKTRTLPVLDARQLFDAMVVVILAVCIGVVEREQYRRQLRTLYKQLEQP
jgi:hypothetical protein